MLMTYINKKTDLKQFYGLPFLKMAYTILLFQLYEIILDQDMDSQVPKIDKVKKKKTKKNWLNIQNGPLTLLGHRESSLGAINKKMHVLGHKMTLKKYIL